MTFDRVAIVGLGLVGGSIARELAGLGVRVLGADRDADTLCAALAAGVVHEPLGPGLEGIEEVDALILAVPVGSAPGLLQAAAPRLGAVGLVTDVGSTKRTICAAAERLGIGDRFVGAHPLAGDHRAGWSASRVGLFRDARVFLCPTAGTSPPALASARTLWSLFGARTEVIGPATHDRSLARTSHLPQVASTALALSLAADGIEVAELGPGGRDMTRLAASSPALWTDIALDNAGELAAAIEVLEARLGELRDALAAGDRDRIRRTFEAAREWGSGRRSGG